MRQLNSIFSTSAARLLTSLLFMLVLSASARADAIYTYNGTPFTSCSGPCFGALSGSVTLAQLLPVSATTSVQIPSVPGYANVLSWNFSDGSFVWRPSNSGLAFIATFTTDAKGQIVQWTLNGGTAIVGLNTFQWKSSNVGCAIHMLTCEDLSTVNGTLLGKSTLPGSWTVATTVPEPSSALLLGVGLVALGAMRGRRLLAAK